MAAHDYGFRTRAGLRGPARTALIAGVVVGFGVLALAIGGTVRARLDAEAADYRIYAASGAPCPETTATQLQARGPRLRYALDFGGMTVTRAFGQADCAWISGPGGRYPICRLSGPGAVAVKAGGRERLFFPDVGRSAAVLRRKGDVVCLIVPRS